MPFHPKLRSCNDLKILLWCVFLEKHNKFQTKDHPEEFEEESGGSPERIFSAEERRLKLRLEPEAVNAVCARSSGTPLPHGVWLTPPEKRNSNTQNRWSNQPLYRRFQNEYTFFKMNTHFSEYIHTRPPAVPFQSTVSGNARGQEGDDKPSQSGSQSIQHEPDDDGSGDGK